MKRQVPKKKPKQLGFEVFAIKNDEKNILKGKKYFGGSLLKKSNAKEKRPISTKKAMHLVLRASMAKGKLSLLKQNKKIQELIRDQGEKHGVKIYKQANGGNHLHLIILPSSREAFKSFVRSISGLIARLILGVERGSAKGIQFWDQRPFTRIIEWGRELKTVSNYLLQNTLEAFGFIPYKPRNSKYKISTA